MGIQGKRQELPRFIVLGGSLYTVVPRNREWMEREELAGQCRFDAMEVDICVDQPNSELANTFIHECLHLCYREWGINPRWHEEKTVTGLGFAMTALYRQNPHINTYIASLLEHHDERDRDKRGGSGPSRQEGTLKERG